MISFKTKFILMRWKTYFDLGLNFMKYPLYMIGLFGLSSRDVLYTMIFGFIYGLLCFIVGWAFVRYDWYKAGIEVSNKYNLFVSQMRRKIKKRNI